MGGDLSGLCYVRAVCYFPATKLNSCEDYKCIIWEEALVCLKNIHLKSNRQNVIPLNNSSIQCSPIAIFTEIRLRLFSPDEDKWHCTLFPWQYCSVMLTWQLWMLILLSWAVLSKAQPPASREFQSCYLSRSRTGSGFRLSASHFHPCLQQALSFLVPLF